jgi:hypothetical protein
MKNILIILSLFFYAQTVVFSQVKTEDFAFMQGNWTGVLEYTDYQDDKTKVQLNTVATCALMFDKMMIHFTYTEPDGRPVYEKMAIYARKKDDLIQFGSIKMKVVKNLVQREPTVKGLLVLEVEGEDNDKKAMIRETINYTKDSFSITKQVRYMSENQWITRHEYRFKKENTDDTQVRLIKALVGTWQLDLRPSPESDSYKKDFEVTRFSDGKLSGVFYGTEFTDGKINTAWGKVYFAFSTGDQSGAYHHSGYIEEGKIYGISRSEGRDFMIPWFGEKKEK